MLDFLWLPCSLPYAFFSVLKIRRELHMLQLNSYRNERYGCWLREKAARPIGNWRPSSPPAVFLSAALPAFSSPFCFGFCPMERCCAAAKKPAKKPLDFTKRARRLFAVALGLYFRAGAGDPIGHPRQWGTERRAPWRGPSGFGGPAFRFQRFYAGRQCFAASF